MNKKINTGLMEIENNKTLMIIKKYEYIWTALAWGFLIVMSSSPISIILA